MSILDEIGLERARQIDKEGFDVDHDDRHSDGSLPMAAMCYCMAASVAARTNPSEEQYKTTPKAEFWPWSLLWWKPKNPRRDLIRAAALIVAEVERLDRSILRGSEQDKANPPPFKPKKYRLKSDYPQWGWKAGLIVYHCKGWDYGCANDDTRALGVEHVSVTLKEDGDYPFNTVPKNLLEMLP